MPDRRTRTLARGARWAACLPASLAGWLVAHRMVRDRRHRTRWAR